jgi:hypothetical protein
MSPLQRIKMLKGTEALEKLDYIGKNQNHLLLEKAMQLDQERTYSGYRCSTYATLK